MKKCIKYALLGMTIVPLFGRIALHGTGHEDELYRFLVPMLVGGSAGFLIGLAKDRLLDSLIQFRCILDTLPYGAIQCDGKGEVLFANRNICDLLAVKEKEFVGNSIWSYCLNDSCRLSMQRSLHQLTESGSFPGSVVSSFCTSAGQQIKVELHWACHDAPDLFYTATIIDITSQVHSQQLLMKLSQVVEHADELIMITDQHGTIEYANPALERTSGYSARELVGEKPSILKSPAQDPSAYKDLWCTISSGKTWRGSMIDRCKDGHFYPVNMSVTPILDDQNEISAYVSIQQDMSLHQELEEKLRQSQKMEALGTLVGGIAHDFNNMLAAVKGHTYLARSGLHGADMLEKRLNHIESLADQGAEMIQQLLTFARKDKVEKRLLSLNQFMLDGYKLAKTIIPDNIEHVTDFCRDPLVIYGNTTQLQQVVMNLVNNACDAVAGVERPRISCSLSRFEADESFSRAHPDLQGSSFARIRICDNGIGINKERQAKIFEPFFTTKGVGEGTGLGLAMVYGAVSAHDGVIEVESEEGKGTSFYVYLLLSDREIGKVESEADMPAVSAGGETILLVDDDDSLRTTTREVLESLNYRVVEACNGEQALQLFEQQRQDIALIITDIVMPKMGGIDLMRLIRSADQTIPVIYITGYDGGSEQAKSLGENSMVSCLINKPFSIPVLCRAIRDMLASAS